MHGLKISFYTLSLVVLITPWLNGGVDLPTRPYVYSLLLIALIAATFDLVVARAVPRLTTATWLTLAAVVLGAISLVPLSTTRFPAKSLELWAELSGAEVATLSLNPSGTRIQLSMLCAFATALLVASQTKLDEFKLRFLSYAMLANGAALTLFAFAQRYSWNGRLFWIFDLPHNETTFGPMVYHNVAGNYLAMCLALGCYVAVKYTRHKRSLSEVDGNSAAVALMLATVAVGLLCSLSRGAILSSVVAFAVVAYLFASRVWEAKTVKWMLPIVLCFAGIMFWFGMSDVVVERMGTLTSGDILTDQRLVHWEAASRAAKDFWGVGCGAGAYGRVVATYETSNSIRAIFNNAHNQFLEFLLIAGIGGLLLFLLLIWTSLRSCMKLTKHAENHLAFLGYVSVFIVLCQTFHALVDFCLMILAVSLPVACIVGFSSGQFAQKNRNGALSKILPVACWGTMVLAMAWATFDAFTAGQLDLAVRQIPWGGHQSQLSQAQLVDGLADIDKALALRPDSMEGQEALAILHTINYRNHARDQLAVEAQLNKDDPNLWQWTSPQVLHHRVHTLRRNGSMDIVAQLREEPLIARHLGAARQSLLKARSSCPLWANLHIRLEELSFLDPSASIESNINAIRVQQTAGQDARMLFECGTREFGAGRYESAYECWQLSLSVSPRYVKEIVRLSSGHLNTSEILQTVMPDSAEVFVRMMAVYKDDDSVKFDETAIQQKARSYLKDKSEIPQIAEDWFVQSRLSALLSQPEKSIDYLDRAIKLKPFVTRWRFDLAQQLAANGQWEEAERQAIRCVRQKRWRIYREFLDNLRLEMRKQNQPTSLNLIDKPALSPQTTDRN